MKNLFLFLFVFTISLLSQKNTFEHIYDRNQEGLKPRGYYNKSFPQCVSVDQDSEGNFILANSFGYIIKTDYLGNLLWIKNKFEIPQGTQPPIIIRNSPDGNYIYSVGNTMLKLNYLGETIWEYKFTDFLIYSVLK